MFVYKGYGKSKITLKRNKDRQYNNMIYKAKFEDEDEWEDTDERKDEEE